MKKRTSEQSGPTTAGTSRRTFLGGAATAAAAALLAQNATTAVAADEAPLRAAVLEFLDPWTSATGLGELLTRVGFVVVTLDPARPATEQGVDVIAFGTFTNNHATYGRYVADHAPSLQEFVAAGGVVLDMAQSDQYHSTASYLPAPMSATRNDSDYDTVFPVATDHPLVSHLRVVDGKVFTGRSTQIRVSWETLLDWSQMRVLLACSGTGRPPALLEGAHGRGRFVLSSLTVDKIYNAAGQTIQPAGAIADSEMFFTGFAAYVRLVVAGTAPVVVPTMQEIAGPLVGDTGTSHSRVLIRPGSDLLDRETWTLEHWSEGGTRQRVRARLSPDNDSTVLFDIAGLTAATTYSYAITPDGDDVPGLDISGSFRTAPADDAATKLVVGLGSCVWTEENHIWDTIRAEGCEAFVLMGDTPYIDSTNLQTARAKHRAFLQQPQVKEVTRTMPVWGTWDDHDFGGNDVHGDLPGKRNNRTAFVDYRANPTFGHSLAGEPLRARTDDGEGIYTSFRRGPLEVFLLDPRWFSRTEPSWADATRTTGIGKVQWEWLQERLLASTAPFKLLASGMIWDDKQNGEADDWGTYFYERDAILDFVQEHGIPGVFLLGGDIHVSRALNYGPRVGYDLWQFIVSPMHSGTIPSLNVPNPALVHSAVEPHVFLRLELDTTVEPATMTATWINRDGERIFEVRTDAAQLAPQPVLVDFPSATTELVPAQASTITTNVTNRSGRTLDEVTTTLEAPLGWQVTATTETTFRDLADGEARVTNWTVEPPAGIQAGDVVLTARSTYSPSGGQGTATRQTTFSVVAEGTVPRSRLSIAGFSSDEAPGQAAVNAIDGAPHSFWHSRWATEPVPGFPHWIALDLGSEHLLDGLGYLTRQTGSTNGRIKDFEIHVSRDNTTWGSPVATGAFPAGTALARVDFAEAAARYIRLTALSSQDGFQFAAAAELTPYGRAAERERPEVTVLAETRTVGVRTVVAVRVQNMESVPVDVKIATDYGSKSFLGIQPGKYAYQSFVTRGAAVPAGAVRVEASGRIDQLAVRNTVTALYDALG